MSDHIANVGLPHAEEGPEVDESRRNFLIAATAGTRRRWRGARAVPFVRRGNHPRARAAGLPTESTFRRWPGQNDHAFLAQETIYVVKRTPEMLSSLRGMPRAQGRTLRQSEQPAYTKTRSVL